MLRDVVSIFILVSLTDALQTPSTKVSTPRAAKVNAASEKVNSAEASPKLKKPTTSEPSEEKYWFDPRIHVFGNVGLGGAMHALVAPVATWMIDKLSYAGFDVRNHVLDTMVDSDATVLDLCCGVGFSSARRATCVDTSGEMLWMARARRPDCTFFQGNAETFGMPRSFDVVTVMFAMHEAPARGRRKILQNAARVARDEIIVVDIDPAFKEVLYKKPNMGRSFLAGEPYVLDYLAKMDSDVIEIAKAGWKLQRITLLPNHVVAWRLNRRTPPIKTIEEPKAQEFDI